MSVTFNPLSGGFDFTKNTEEIQDAVGAMIGSSLQYVDATPLLDTIQDIRTSASPSFTGLTLSGFAVDHGIIFNEADVLTVDAGLTYNPAIDTFNVTGLSQSDSLQIDSPVIGAEQITNGTFTGGITSWTAGAAWYYCYKFTVSGITTTPSVGSTWTNNGQTFTVRYTKITTSAPKSGFMMCSGTGAPAASGTLTKTGGTGDATVAFSAYTENHAMKGATGTSTLSQATMTTNPVVGKQYQLSFTLSQCTSAAFTVTVGGASFTPTTLSISAGATTTYPISTIFTATTTDGIVFTPGSTARFIIDDISIKEVSGTAITNGTVLMQGTYGSGEVTPVMGAGTRLMWIPAKGAFRVGTLTAPDPELEIEGCPDYWDNYNIGNNSVVIGLDGKAFGEGTIAISTAQSQITGAGSVGIGQNNISGEYSFGFGSNNISGDYSYGFGGCLISADNARAFGSNIIFEGATQSTAVGYNTIGINGDALAGAYSTGIGYSNTITGTYAAGIGSGLSITGDYAIGVGANTTVSGSYALGFGNLLTASGMGTTCLGYQYTESTDQSFNWGYEARRFQITAYNTQFGNTQDDNDYTLDFLAKTSSGQFKWMEDEDYFSFTDGILIPAGEQIYFRDTAIHIASADDGHLDLTADTSIDLNGVTLAMDKIAFTQTDGNEYIDSLADGYLDLGATTAVRSQGRFQTLNGVIGKITTATDTYAILVTDETVICNKSTNFTVTLPTAVVGQKFTIKNIGAGVVTVDGASTDTIDGSLTQSLIQWETFGLQCYAANSWAVI